jgi:hypothetical protein
VEANRMCCAPQRHECRQWPTQKSMQAGGSHPDRLVHDRESRPGGVGWQSQKLEHPRELTRWIGKEFLEEQKEAVRSRGVSQHQSKL